MDEQKTNKREDVCPSKKGQLDLASVRAEIDNPDGALKPMMFADFTIITGDAVVAPAGPIFQWPFMSSPSNAAKHASESKAGTQSQSIEPSRQTSAAVLVSPMSA